jgi:hypothetical protein
VAPFILDFILQVKGEFVSGLEGTVRTSKSFLPQSHGAHGEKRIKIFAGHGVTENTERSKANNNQGNDKATHLGGKLSRVGMGMGISALTPIPPL